MMKSVPLFPRQWPALFLLVVFAACGIPAGKAPQPLAQPQTVLLVSLDGFRRDYLDRDSPPALTALGNDGVVAAAMIPSFPTLTFPNHYSIVTGLYPEHHGIVANTMWDSVFDIGFTISGPEVQKERWWGGEPIWVTAERQGVKSASFFWVGSEAPIGGIRPSIYKKFDGKVTFEARVDSVLAWLSLPAAQRPRMITLYFNEPDHIGHEKGPDSPETHAAILMADSAIGRLVAGLRSQGMYDAVNLIVVSDHGMANISPDRYVYLTDVLDTLNVRTIDRGPIFMGWALNGDNVALVAALRRLPHVQAWLKRDIPDRLHFRDNRRITPVVALAETGWMINVGKPTKNRNLGTHGFDNADPLMNALFIAHGPAFKSGARIPAFPNVDVYSLMARILGLTPAPNDGSLSTLERALR
ncbi:MAG TPA: ectonucleotide pyrophosphatase/phosphodiesterase [Thermoanaerobaculia bacterium]|nr:ectonucleotide pyrophosphatase/phosphodiesterase [Thermoanaerobaculia bacterium]